MTERSAPGDPSRASAHRPRREHGIALRSFHARLPERGEPVQEPARVNWAGSRVARLVPNVLLTDAASSQAHLDALGHLVRRLPAFRLATGTDLEAAVELLDPIVGT